MMNNSPDSLNNPGCALQSGFHSCPSCGKLMPSDSNTCPLCLTIVSARKKHSLSKTMAFLLTALILFFPANLLPTMTTVSLLGKQDDTIMSGIIYLWVHGDKPVAIIVFVASILTPLFKIISIFYLCITCYFRSTRHIQFRTKLYHFNELIGRWSMIDVFVVALLGALVQMGSLATIQPRVGIIAFALVVFFSIISLQQFDPRLIWDYQAQSKQDDQSSNHEP